MIDFCGVCGHKANIHNSKGECEAQNWESGARCNCRTFKYASL